MRNLSLVVSLALAAACGGRANAPAAVPAAATPAPASGDGDARRDAWLREVEGYVADPTPLIGPSGRAALERLLGERAWLEMDINAHFDQFVRLSAALPALMQQLVLKGGIEESMLARLYFDEIARSSLEPTRLGLLRAAGDDPDRLADAHDTAEWRSAGAAVSLYMLWLQLERESEPVRTRVTARLGDAATYAGLSADSLQLLLASIDEHAPHTDVDRKRIREVVAAAHAQRSNATPPTRSYEPAVIWPGTEPRPIASRAGGFAITVGQGALVWSSTDDESGVVFHELEWRSGGLVLHVSCFDDVPIDAFVAQILAGNIREDTGPGPGRWFTMDASGLRSRLRVIEIGPRLCAGAADSLTGKHEFAEMDRVLATMRAAP